MHQKLRNSLISLGAAFAMILGGIFFGEPLAPAGTVAAPAQTELSPEARIALAVLNATVSIAQAQSELEENEAAETSAASERPAPSRRNISTRHLRPSLGMPYFSFASFLPRAPQES